MDPFDRDQFAVELAAFKNVNVSEAEAALDAFFAGDYAPMRGWGVLVMPDRKLSREEMEAELLRQCADITAWANGPWTNDEDVS